MKGFHNGKPMPKGSNKPNKSLSSALTVANPAVGVPPPVSSETPSGPVAQSAKAPKRPARAATKSTAAPEKPTPAVLPTVEVKFWLLEPHAKRVFLSGVFNGWSPDATPMQRQSDGRWETTLALRPGRYQYKFVVDGEWIPDVHAMENVVNDFGTLNSVVEVSENSSMG
jgi:hypothetical protein